MTSGFFRSNAGQRAAEWLRCSAGAFIGYLIAGWVGLTFAGPLPFLSPFWPAGGLALIAVLRRGPACLPGLLAGSMAVDSLNGTALGLAALIALGNVGGPWLAAQWLQRIAPGAQLARRHDLWRLMLAAAAGSAALSAANGTAWFALAGQLHTLDMPLDALQWWMADALGVLAVAVPALGLGERRHMPAPWSSQRWANAALVSASLLALIWAYTLPPRLDTLAIALLALPPLLLGALALRSSYTLASAVALALMLGMFGATAHGVGPFAARAPEAGMSLQWVYALVLSLVTLLPHARVSELLRREERWSLALDGSDLGVADWNLQSACGFSTPRWRSLMDDPQGTDTATFERWLALVHPDDRPALRAVLAARAQPGGPHHRHEVRLRPRDRWRRFDIHLIVAERDAAGAPRRVVATADDVTERREAQDARQLSTSLFNSLHEGLVIADADLRVIDANPAYTRITGVPREELVGAVPSLLRPLSSDPATRAQQAALRAALRTQGGWAGEVIERRRNGDPCALHLTLSSVHAPDGELRCHVLIVSDVTEARLQRDRLERQAHFDELTRLPNRTRLGQLLAEAMAAADRTGSLLAVCDLDLDHLKSVNERWGRDAGDLLLAEIANRLHGALRHRGKGASDVAARLGGDEFALLLHVDSADEARAAAERMLHVVGQPVAVAPDAAVLRVTASMGATLYPLDASDADTLLRHADHAMYDVKQGGRNGWLFFDPEHSRRTEERVHAIGRVQDALDHHELALYYQPKVDLKRGTVLGVEALLRWNHPEQGLLPPGQFLPLIENTGLSARVGDHVLASALDQLDAWLGQGLELSLSVNVSARHLQEPDFAQRLGELLARHARRLGPRLELEVLETAALADIGYSSALLERCARLGVRWALDDFGTGYSTLTYLKRLPVQVLKIDRSFVHGMLDDAQDRAIVEGVISLARTFGCTAVAEGVETAAQARLLLDMGCEIGQGAGIAAPMPADALPGWIREWRGLFTLSAASPAAAEPALPPREAGAND